jgi:hypothetical protein
MTKLKKIDWQVWIPHLVVFCWLIYLGVAIWCHAIHSVQPPLYDPLSYMQKAISFWGAIEKGDFFNPLSLNPTVRPPGTILMSYPFGISQDFQGYHFRSVFFPIVCTVAAVYIAAGMTKIKTLSVWVAAIAILFSSLPLFYFFDWLEDIEGPTRWGLVDNFHAGMASVSLAALVRSLMNRSQLWLFFSAFFASFTLLIKPSGLMVMVLIALTWIIIIAFEWLRNRKLHIQDSSLYSYALKGTILLGCVYILTISLCFFSEYLSEANFSYAKKALIVMKEVLHIPFWQTLTLLHQTSGEVLLIWLVLVSVLFSYYLVTKKLVYDLLILRIMGLLICSLFIFISGMGYTIFIQEGGSQIRYFSPFLMMGAVCVIPAALSIWLQANRWWRGFLMLVCLLPAINIGLLLGAGDHPSVTWQNLTGVGVSVGQGHEEVDQAYDFINKLKNDKKNVVMYSFASGIPPAIFENVGMYEEMLNPKLPVFHVVIPTDWVRGFAVRIDELQNPDYILIRKYKNLNELDKKEINSFETESLIFQIWLSTLNESSGVKIISDGRVLRLLYISNKLLFNKAITSFVAKHNWRPEFVLANPPAFWNRETVSAYAKNVLTKEIKFSDIYKVNAMAINQIDRKIKVEVWWEELKHEEKNNHRKMFIHLKDSSENIIGNKEIPLYPYLPLTDDTRWRYSTVTYGMRSPVDKPAFLGFGIFLPPDEFILPDNGISDMAGKRVLISLNPSLQP